MDRLLKFSEWLALRTEGLLLPNQNAVPGMSKINPFPATQARLKGIAPKKPKAPQPFKPTVAPVGALPQPSFGPAKIVKVPKPRLPRLP
jgi:hypothetical protein